jgi:hypothetical protein
MNKGNFQHLFRNRLKALSVTRDISRQIATVTHEPHWTTFLRLRISVTVQTGNAYCILAFLRTFKSVGDENPKLDAESDRWSLHGLTEQLIKNNRFGKIVRAIGVI